ncbi:type II toxin-antitoxin system RelE/ParE family toxin [Aetokthonos hydrillicola Thurmond2011]|jgi:toxin ParE1/3/4|uniref:Type II toxin-antitoxin system RelE/ParE family toxin n=1 Tax=Aetokthonos hydrillicola Thurmond2011 TaxID=2712845 RepID=A0AAP5IHS3_9CYAN|nr:type II toxin-antitoxin system RelE/ParE family toxin [Aetokthonos hydrillicola]MDR9900957.1 type II toxin-antitoxin system RelE/ParE family toxin [Aetokthonos hydrillicola Thurmond2011]
MTYSIIRTRLADEDLLEIWSYIAQNNVEAADRIFDKIDQKCQLLSTTPKAGVRRDDLVPGLLCLIEGNYLIFYRIIDETIEILRILHGARNLKAIFHQ